MFVKYISHGNGAFVFNIHTREGHSIKMQLIKTCSKGWRMSCLENFYIQHQLQLSLIDEQNISEINPLFTLVHDSNS